MGYPTKEGRNGPIYQIADGLTITPDERGTWLLVLRSGAARKKRSFGKTVEDRQRAIKAAELLAARLGLSLEKKTEQGRTFGMVAEEWYNSGVAKWRPGTQERYNSIIRDFLPPLSILPLDQVDRIQVKKLLTELLKIRSPKTVEVVHAVISGIFNEAIDIGYTEQNPAHGLLRKILPAKSKRNRTRSDPFTVQDRDRFLEAASAKLPEPYPLVLEIMAMTGLRLGEALAMSWENFDINNCQYQVTESVKLGKFGPPKSGERLVDLDAALVTKIEAYQRKMGKGKVRFSARYLFPEVSQRMIQRAMERACREARLRRRHPHDLRHTYATILLMAHISPAYVQKQLGHHSISMTVDIYGHWIPGEGRENLDKVLRPNSKPGHPFSVVRRGKE